MPFLQRFDQVRIDHRHTTPDVDEHACGLEFGEQFRIEQVVGFRGIRQQVDNVIHFADQTIQIRQSAHFNERCLGTWRRSNAIQLNPERQQELRHALADIASADDQRLAPGQTLAQSVIPFALDLANEPRQHFTLMAQHVSQHKLGHDLTEDAHGTGQPVFPGQTFGQQWGDPGPRRLQPLRGMPLAQQGGQQVRLTQPDRAVCGHSRQLGRIAGTHDFQVGCNLAQQLGVKGVIVFSNQNAHGSKPLKTEHASVDGGQPPSISVALEKQSTAPTCRTRALYRGSLRRSSSSGRCSMYSSSAGGICR